MALLPARNILDGTALPVTSQMKTALGSLRDYCSDLLGTDSSNKAAARTALGAAASGPLASSGITGAAASGANTDITSITGNAATATTAAACSGNAATATKLSNDTGSAPSYSCRAWVNFNGTGTVAIRASGNVSSITDNGVGEYTVNFATAMADANYAAACSSSEPGVADGLSMPRAYGASSLRVSSVRNTGVSTLVDMSQVQVAIFR